MTTDEATEQPGVARGLGHAAIQPQDSPSPFWIVVHVPHKDRAGNLLGVVADFDGALELARAAKLPLRVSARARAQMETAGAAPEEWPGSR